MIESVHRIRELLDVPTASEQLEELTVNEAIRLWPSTVIVFNDFGIDACCGGAISIRQAAVRDGADPEQMVAALWRAIVGEPR